MSRVLWARGWGAVALIGAVAVGLSGCSPERGTEPPPSPSVSGSSSSSSSSSGSGSASGSASPTPSASIEVPEAARANTQEGAVAFARWYVEAGSQAFVDWDANVIEGFAEPGCTVCAGLAKSAREWQAQGHRTPTRRYQFESSQVGPTQGGYIVDLAGKEQATKVLDGGGNVVIEYPEKPTFLRVTLRWGASSWRVVQVQGIVNE